MSKHLKKLPYILAIIFIIYILIVSNNLTFHNGYITILQYFYADFGILTKSLL